MLHLISVSLLPDALQAGASQFEASAGKLKNKYWWKNMKVFKFYYSFFFLFYLDMDCDLNWFVAFTFYKMTLALSAIGLIVVVALGCKYLIFLLLLVLYSS